MTARGQTTLAVLDARQCTSCSFIPICVISKFTDTLIVIYEGRTVSTLRLTRLPCRCCQLNGDRWGHGQRCNPDSRAKTKWWFQMDQRSPPETLTDCSACFLFLFFPTSTCLHHVKQGKCSIEPSLTFFFSFGVMSAVDNNAHLSTEKAPCRKHTIKPRLFLFLSTAKSNRMPLVITCFVLMHNIQCSRFLSRLPCWGTGLPHTVT